jgi:hypothetical protein
MRTPLHYVAAGYGGYGNGSASRALECGGANVGLIDANGDQPLGLVALEDEFEITSDLLESGAAADCAGLWGGLLLSINMTSESVLSTVAEYYILSVGADVNLMW